MNAFCWMCGKPYIGHGTVCCDIGPPTVTETGHMYWSVRQVIEHERRREFERPTSTPRIMRMTRDGTGLSETAYINAIERSNAALVQERDAAVRDAGRAAERARWRYNLMVTDDDAGSIHWYGDCCIKGVCLRFFDVCTADQLYDPWKSLYAAMQGGSDDY